MMWYWGGGVHWWGWLVGFFGMAVFWGVVIWGIWYLFAGLSRGSQHQPPAGPPAKQILDERLVRGEISPEEYRRLRDMITGSGDEASAAGSAR